jgi:hypothetical protein
MLTLKPNRVVKPIILVLKALAESGKAKEIDIIRKLHGCTPQQYTTTLLKQ